MDEHARRAAEVTAPAAAALLHLACRCKRSHQCAAGLQCSCCVSVLAHVVISWVLLFVCLQTAQSCHSGRACHDDTCSCCVALCSNLMSLKMSSTPKSLGMQYFWWMARSDVTSLTMTRADLKSFLDNDDDIDDVFGALMLACSPALAGGLIFQRARN